MLKKQLLLTAIGLVLVLLLLIFGTTIAPKGKNEKSVISVVKVFDIQKNIQEEKEHLSASKVINLNKLENNVTRSSINNQLIIKNIQIANFWKDSSHAFEPYIYYLSEAAKLDKSEKNLTFAAQLILNNLRGEQDESKLNWKTDLAINLFERGIELYPNNDDLKIGLGSCYVFGKGRTGGAQETMKGIQQLLSVVRKDSNNMNAQMMLGVGGYVSGQYDKAISRLQKVIAVQPENIEAIAFLADTYAAKGNKEEAIKWYLISKRLINNPKYSFEIEERIKLLR